MTWCKQENLLYIAVLILVEAAMFVNIEAMVFKRASIFAQSDDDIKMLELCAVRNQQRLGSVFGNFTRHHKKAGHKKKTTTPAPASQNTSTTEEDIKFETTTTLPNNLLPRPQSLTSIDNQNKNVNTNIDSIETDEEFDELIEKERHKKHKEKELLHEVVEKHSNKVKKMYRDATANVNKLSGKVKAGGGGTFLTDNCTTVLAQIGTTAVLHCEVTDITENTVTWIRRKDYSLLSVGLVTYSADNRFFSAHGRHVKDWALHIRFATSADAGFYECQVPKHPPTSIFFKLVLVAAYAEIMGESEKIIHEGSMLRLVCVVRRSTEPPSYVFWYFENRMINYDLNGVTVHNGRQTSELVIGKAQHRHAGNYTCVPANAKAASVTVHVVQSETPAAMQHGNKSSTSCKNLEISNLVLFTLILLLTYNNIASSTYSEYG